jgi:hypothetical protein
VIADIVVKIRVARYEFARQAAVLGQVLDLLATIDFDPAAPTVDQVNMTIDPAPEPSRPVSPPEGPVGPRTPAVPDVQTAAAGPAGPVVIPAHVPGKRREFTEAQTRILLDDAEEHGILATARKFDVAESVLHRMRRRRNANQSEASIARAADPAVNRTPIPAPTTHPAAGPDLETVPDIQPQNPAHRFVCSCAQRFPTAKDWGAHRTPVPENKKKLHRLVEQPAVRIVGSRSPARRAGEEDRAWEQRKRNAAGEAM